MKRRIALFMVLILITSVISPVTMVSAADTHENENTVIIQNIRAVAVPIDEAELVVHESDFNYVIDNVSLSIRHNTARINTTIDGRVVEFNPLLFNSQLGFNADNTLFGVYDGTSSGFSLLRFTMERDSMIYSLVPPNLYMVGETVVTIILYNYENRMSYFFQFIAKDISFPVLFTRFLHDEYELINLELKNFIALPEEFCLFEIHSGEIESPLFIGYLEGIFGEFDNFDDYVEFDDFIIEMTPTSNSIIPDFPDSRFFSHRRGWNNWSGPGWRRIFHNAAQRVSFYEAPIFGVYMVEALFVGEHWHYFMRILGTAHNRPNSGHFDIDVFVTHSGWMWHHLHTSTLTWDGRTSSQRIIVNTTWVEYWLTNGNFVAMGVGSRTRGGLNRNVIMQVVVRHIPKVGSAIGSTQQIFSSGDRIRHGTKTPIRRTDGRFEYRIRAYETQLREVGHFLRLELDAILHPGATYGFQFGASFRHTNALGN